MTDALGAGFGQSVLMVADVLGFDIDPDLRTTHQMAVATAPIDSPIGPIAPGTVAAQRFMWEATVDDVPVVSAAVNWLMGEDDLDPPWRLGPARERFEVEVTGDPNCLTTFQKLHPESVAAGLIRNPGIVATALHCVNAIPYVSRRHPDSRRTSSSRSWRGELHQRCTATARTERIRSAQRTPLTPVTQRACTLSIPRRSFDAERSGANMLGPWRRGASSQLPNPNLRSGSAT